VFHLQGDLVEAAVLKTRADLLGTTSPSVLVYAALDGWRRQMVEHGRELLQAALDVARSLRAEIDGIDGLHVHGADDFLGPGRGAEMDPLQVIIDISGLGVTGYSAADWLREHHLIDLHISDHRRISAQLSFADDEESVRPLVAGLRHLVEEAGRGNGSLDRAGEVHIPSPDELRLETVHLPRDAFFGRTEQVPVERAADRIVAEMLTPYPPGIPAAVPGERLNSQVIDYLRTGLEAGMVIPDASDAELKSIRVLREP
jgi:arginine decarboxylase